MNIIKCVKYLVSIMFFSQSLLDALFGKLIYTVKNYYKCVKNYLVGKHLVYYLAIIVSPPLTVVLCY